jgi:hypothetical protein
VHRSLRENRPVGAEIVIIDHAVAHSGVHTITLARKKIVKRPVGISYRAGRASTRPNGGLSNGPTAPRQSRNASPSGLVLEPRHTA